MSIEVDMYTHRSRFCGKGDHGLCFIEKCRCACHPAPKKEEPQAVDPEKILDALSLRRTFRIIGKLISFQVQYNGHRAEAIRGGTSGHVNISLFVDDFTKVERPDMTNRKEVGERIVIDLE